MSWLLYWTVYLKGYLLGRFRISETEQHAADLIDDDNADAFDIVIMIRILIYDEVDLYEK